MTKQQIADKYAGQPCTLNGKPAKIMGRLEPFALVGQLPQGLAVEFAWETVDYVMTERDGAFNTQDYVIAEG